MKEEQTCSYLKLVWRKVAAANGVNFEISECTFKGNTQVRVFCAFCRNYWLFGLILI